VGGLGDRPVLLEPGVETYTARTFSRRRYESQLLSSFGHPVPVVAVKLQRTGALRAGIDRLQATLDALQPAPRTTQRQIILAPAPFP
jgi:hypothetical protein